MKTPIFFCLLLILCVSQAHAVTVMNSRYSSALPVGSQDSFQMVLKPDTPEEGGVLLDVSMDDSDCSPWVTLDTQTVTLSNAGTPVQALIHVPNDATNGDYRCYATFTAPAVGMVQSEIKVPFSITVVGGVEPTEVPLMVTVEQTTVAQQSIQTESVQQPVITEQTPVAVPPPTTATDTTYQGYIIGGFIVLIIAVGAIAAYDVFKKRRKT